MNLDHLFSWSSLFDKDNLKEEVELQNPFSGSVFYDTPDADILYILIAPWHAGSYIFSRVKSKIKRAGKAYVQYNLIPDVLSPDVEATRSYFEIVNQCVRKDMLKIHRETGIKRFVIVGLSLSCVFASMIANDNDLVTDVVLVVPGHSLAESLWKGLRTQRIKKIMKREGITLAKLKRYWIDLAPEEYLKGMKGKKVAIVISKADRIIPYRFGKRLVDHAEKVIPNLSVEENRFLGHYGTVIRFCLFPRELKI